MIKLEKINIVGRPDDIHNNLMIDMGVLKGPVNDESEKTELPPNQRTKDLGVVRISDIPMDQIN